MKKSKFFIIILTILFSVSACTSGVNNPTETANNVATSPTSSDKAPSVTNTPTISYEGDEDIYIQTPGSLSELTSPINLSGMANASFEQTLVIKLVDINGLTLAEQVTSINADIGLGGPFETDVIFTVSETTRARLSVYTTSAKDGGIIHLNSIPVTLLASGPETLTTNPASYETILINSPILNQEISGGTLSFSGESEYFFESNLVVILCGEGGMSGFHEICGSEDNNLVESYVMIASPDIGQPGPFSSGLKYVVTEPTHARFVVFARSPMDGAIEHLSSVEVLLLP